MNINLGDLPAWLATIGTIGALVAALYQISNERKRRIAQEASDRIERRLTQARLIAAWSGGRYPFGTYGQSIEMINSSTEPIYEIIAAIVFIDDRLGASAMESVFDDPYLLSSVALLNILPPGRWRVGVNIGGPHGNSDRPPFGAELAFTDRAGVHWIRRADGNLEELPQPPFECFAKLERDRRDFQVPEAAE